MPDHAINRNTTKVWLVGGGIASLAAAAFMIRDGDIPGHDITILEELDKIGGSLDASGSSGQGFVLRGLGRMFESKSICTYAYEFDAKLNPHSGGRATGRSRKENIGVEMKSDADGVEVCVALRAPVMRRRETAPEFGLSERHILTIERLALEPEAMLGRTRISDQFDPAFFKTDFWLMWCTTFAFQPWHSAVEFKRYLVRFAHMVEGFNRLKGIMRTVYNQ